MAITSSGVNIVPYYVFPGLAIMFTVMGFNFLGDGLRDSLALQHGATLGQETAMWEISLWSIDDQLSA